MIKQLTIAVFLIFIFNACNNKYEQKKTTIKENNTISNIQIYETSFLSLDSLEISAKVYEVSPDAPVILLCHQARFNKFEYEGIAQKLNERGFNCVAIDQRSGGPISNQINETTIRAIEANKPIGYLDAEQDILAAINYTANKYHQKVILWGSSYSSTLALYIALSNDQVKAVLSFSPGNYFADEKGSLIEKLALLTKPMFITSSKRESSEISQLISQMTLNKNQVHFIPKGNGHHGSRVLWKQQTDGQEYWEAVNAFLDSLKNNN